MRGISYVGQSGRSKNGHSQFKLILYCCSLPNISPHTIFHRNWMANTEVENFRYWSVLVGRSARIKNSNSFFFPILAPLPNLFQIDWKTQLKMLPLAGRGSGSGGDHHHHHQQDIMIWTEEVAGKTWRLNPALISLHLQYWKKYKSFSKTLSILY